MIRALIAIALFFLPSCTVVTVEGECIHTKEVKMSYQCERDGKIRTLTVPLPE